MNTFPRAAVRRSGTDRPGHGRKFVAILVMLAFCHLAVVPAGWAKEESQDPASEAGLGVASVILTIPYGALKVAYAILGGITGGFTYVLTGGNLKAAQAVWDTSLRGTYIITPDHLRGDKPVRFLGVPAESESPKSSQAAPPAGPAAVSSEKSARDAAAGVTPSGPAPTIQAGPASSFKDK